MKGKTHVAVGVGVSALLMARIFNTVSIIGMFVAAMASVLPDIDHPTSMINQKILPFNNGMVKTMVYVSVGLILIICNIFFISNPLLLLIGVTSIAIGISAHRNGFTHSLIGIIVFCLIFEGVTDIFNTEILMYYFVIGYTLHLLCDMFTRHGVPLLYPVLKKKFKFPYTYRVGSKKGEMIEEIALAVSVGCTAYVIATRLLLV